MKIVLRVIGVLLLLMGPIWFLQGANVLTAGNSPMIGDTRSEFYGGLAALIGAALVVFSWRKTSSLTVIKMVAGLLAAQALQLQTP